MPSPEKLHNAPHFVFPSVEWEMGEIEKVAKTFAQNDEVDFVAKFCEKAR